MMAKGLGGKLTPEESQLRSMGFKDAQIARATCRGKPLVEEPSRGSRADGNCRIYLTIFGAPIGKPRMTQCDKWKQRPCVMRYREWSDLVRSIAGDIPPAEKVEAVNWTAYFEPPASWPKKKRCAVIGERHRQYPDLDNIGKAILDCLFERDEAIADGTWRKRWDWKSRLEVEIVVDATPASG